MSTREKSNVEQDKPKIGDRKTIAGVECIFIPDPWSWLYNMPCWCSVKEVEKEFKL